MKRRILSTLVLVVMCMSVFSGCVNKKVAKGGITTLTWYLPGIVEGDGKDAVIKKVNDLLAKKYQMNLNLIAVDFGNYAKKMQIVNSGREKYDLAFTSNWLSNYYANVSSGAFADISELLPKYAPKLYASMSERIWNAIKVDKKLYGVPNWQVQAKAIGLYFPKEKLEKTQMQLEGFNTVEDVTPYLEKIVKLEPDSDKVADMWSSLTNYYGMLELVEQTVPGAVYYKNDGNPIVINQYETDEFKNYIKLKRDWVDKKIAFGNYLPNSKAIKKEVQQLPFYIQTIKPGGISEFSTVQGYEWVAKQISPTILNTDGIISSMTAVSQTSPNPEKAVEFLEIINSDKELYNLLAFGIEGVNYTKISENKIKLIPNSGYGGIQNWEMGSVANSYVLDGQEDDVWEKTKEFNNNAIISPVLGFNPVLDNINTEIANCKSVLSEQLTMLDLGLVPVDEGLETLKTSLKKAGVDKIISELQIQIDVWVANK